MAYIERVDEELVKNFAKKYFKKYYDCENIQVLRCKASWRIVAFVDKKVIRPQTISVSLYDFGVSSLNTYALAILRRPWQLELYRQFGDEYLADLKEAMYSKTISDMKKKVENINKFISGIEKDKNNDKTM